MICLQSLLKTLIHAMSQMDVLPKRRFATFKLFYTDKTPPEYEPPHFQAGDAEKDKWYFMTHDLDEVPDRWSIGRVNTGYHSVNLSVTSIATYLPSSTRFDNATFGGITQFDPATSLTPEQEACMRAQQREEQVDDADDRNIAWSGEDNVELVDMDADGEDDPEYVQLSDGTYEKRPVLEAPDIVTPIGIKNDRGIIEPLPMEVDQSEVCFVGVTEVVPTGLAELAGQDTVSDIEQTQSIEGLAVQLPEATAAASGHFDVRLGPVHSTADVLGFAATDKGSTSYNEMQEMATTSGLVDKGLDCECGVTIEDSCCFCEGGCGRWYHVWCMGYHSVKDTRMPSKFVCFDCRLRADLTWELVKNELYPRIKSKFRELALFRRAIKVVELMKPSTLVEFNKSFGSDHGLARQLFKRLESEGFISDQCTVVDEFDLTGRNTRNKTKTNAKAAKKKKVQKPIFAFNRAIKSSQVYLDYFNPDPEVESRLMALADLKTNSTSYIDRDNTVTARAYAHADDDSQTQEETQLAAMADLTFDERRDDGVDRPRKRIKISVTMGVDLAE
ncbi:hypothetical protein AX14_001704 [Amanita brunnescens Koide BX004]|nr:hypothetical protein AX14_001704 [Amanita brunnescens Koide BX004]